MVMPEYGNGATDQYWPKVAETAPRLLESRVYGKFPFCRLADLQAFDIHEKRPRIQQHPIARPMQEVK
jgi:hypothetical protein